MNNLVLIGMPSSGKSTAGAVAAKKLGYRFLDCDALIREAERAPLAEIIERRGTEGFLAAEARVNGSLNVSRCVIATGGSVVYCPNAMAHLKKIGTVVYLKIGAETVKKRIPDFTARGVVMRGDISTLDELYRERAPLYEKYADLTVDCDNLSVEAAADALILAFNKENL